MFAVGSALTLTVLTVASNLSDVSAAIDIFSNPHVKSALNYIGTHSIPVPFWLAILFFASFVYVFFLPDKRPLSQDGAHLLPNSGAYLSQLARIFDLAQSEIIIAFPDPDLLFRLFPMMILCRIRNVPVYVIYAKFAPHRRFNLMRRIGCQVTEVDILESKIPMKAIICDAENGTHGSAIVFPRETSEGSFATVHSSPQSFYIVQALRSQAQTLIPPSGPGESQFTPTIVKVNFDDLKPALKQVRFYRNSDFELTDIQIESVKPIARAVEQAKVKQAEELISYYKNNQLTLFEPTAVMLSDGAKSLIVPPVIESHNDVLTVAEGHSRLFALRSAGIAKVRVILVTKISDPPPAVPIEWADVTCQVNKVTIDNKDLARKIESTLHKDLFPSLP